MSRSRPARALHLESPRPAKLSPPYLKHCSHHHPQPIRPRQNFFPPLNTSRIHLSVSRPPNPSICPKHATAGDLRTLPSAAPPGAAARLDRPAAQIPASADITTPRRLRWQPVPATTAAAAAAAARRWCARRSQRVRAIRQLHERPGGATRIAVRPDRISAGTGIHRAEREREKSSCPIFTT